jgi:hypothetical protein
MESERDKMDLVPVVGSGGGDYHHHHHHHHHHQKLVHA